MMYISGNRVRRRVLYLSLSLALVLVFAFSACGTNTSTTTGNPPSANGPTPTATTPSQASAAGCPDNITVSNPPSPATVTLTTADSHKTVEAKKGDTIEIHLSFGHVWQGPTSLSQDLLAMQNPSGYASTTAKACVWRFVATGTGIAHLSFNGRALCKKGQVCPMYILVIPFTLDIK